MRMFLIAAVMTMSAGASCILVENEQIRAADLARSVRGLASLAPETVFGYAPQPGAMRVVSAQDIRRFAAANGVDVDTAEPVCVEYGVRVLERTDVEQAIRKVLEDGIELEVVDFTRAAVPRGELAFAKTGLLIPAEPSSEAVLWRGHVLYGQRSAAPIWARVRLTVTRTEVVAVRDLRPGAAIAEADRVHVTRMRLCYRARLSGLILRLYKP
ncbi:MAG TPA: hypothetical protein VFL57_12315 [Bryobacteraceae bacterium]|nr:hypothetical protein [Bryobacteraceae bacterium]